MGENDHLEVARRLTDRSVARYIQGGFSAARELHGHFYNSYLDADGVAERIADTKSCIAALLNLYHQHARQ